LDYRSAFSHDRSSNASTMFQVRISSIYYRVSVSFSNIPFYELDDFLMIMLKLYLVNDNDAGSTISPP
jgi:hypothetical protein